MEALNHEEDALELASKTWNRVINIASKTGFREGVTDGSTSVFQDGFDRGYKDAFRATFLVGAYKGLANILKINSEYPPEVEDALSNTKRGVCHLCRTESNDVDAATSKTIDEIENDQSEHSKQTLNIVQRHFDPLFKEFNINSDFFNLYRS